MGPFARAGGDFFPLVVLAKVVAQLVKQVRTTAEGDDLFARLEKLAESGTFVADLECAASRAFEQSIVHSISLGEVHRVYEHFAGAESNGFFFSANVMVLKES